MRPRVGHIHFLNCFPLYYGLIQHKVLLDVDLLKGTPRELNRMLRRTFWIWPHFFHRVRT